ncbi:Uncharacterized protein HZ326_19698 [Fusarium oxysporum f. sp. albedinis]|nr:Uncharacterized protein HZ326_19698 [Fusarium oxysporum f. sp. albedinis]
MHHALFLVSALYQSSYIASDDGILRVSHIKCCCKASQVLGPQIFTGNITPQTQSALEKVQTQFKTRSFSHQRGTASVAVTVFLQVNNYLLLPRLVPQHAHN